MENSNFTQTTQNITSDIKQGLGGSKKWLGILSLVFLVLGIPLAIWLLQRTQIFAPKAEVKPIELVSGGDSCVVSTDPNKVTCVSFPIKLTSPFGPSNLISTPSAQPSISPSPEGIDCTNNPNICPQGQICTPLSTCNEAGNACTQVYGSVCKPVQSPSPSPSPSASTPSGPTPSPITQTNPSVPKVTNVVSVGNPCVSGGGIKITWTNPSGILFHRIDKTSDGTNWVFAGFTDGTKSPPASQYIDHSGTPGSFYAYRVYAAGNKSNPGYSDPVVQTQQNWVPLPICSTSWLPSLIKEAHAQSSVGPVTTFNDSVPKVTNVVSVGVPCESGGGIKVTWTNPQSGVLFHRIDKTSDGTTWSLAGFTDGTAATPGSEFIDKSGTPGAFYAYRVYSAGVVANPGYSQPVVQTQQNWAPLPICTATQVIPALGDNLLLNPNFKDCNTNSWTAWNDANGTTVMATIQGGAEQTGCAVTFNCNASSATAACKEFFSIYQDINTSALGGKTIYFGGKFATTNSPGRLDLVVFELNPSDTSFQNGIIAKHAVKINATTTFQDVISSFIVNANTKTLRFQIYPKIGETFKADDLFIKEALNSSPSPVSLPGTLFYKVAETEAGLAGAKQISYQNHPTITPFTFKDQKPGAKQIWVEFIGADGSSRIEHIPVELVEPEPVIASLDCSMDISRKDLKLTLKGTRLGNGSGKVLANSKEAQILTWSDSEVTATIKPTENLEDGKLFKVILTRADGKALPETTCLVNTTVISLGARLFCREPGKFDVSGVKVTLVDQNGNKVNEEVTIDKDGLIKGLKTKLQVDKVYIISVKAPNSLRRNAQFIAAEGTNVITPAEEPNFILPVGDISPVILPDGKINTLDHAEIVRQWSVLGVGTVKTGDFNKDTKVNSIDWACMRYDFNKEDDLVPTKAVIAAPSPTPTPASSASPIVSSSPLACPTAPTCLPGQRLLHSPLNGNCADYYCEGQRVAYFLLQPENAGAYVNGQEFTVDLAFWSPNETVNLLVSKLSFDPSALEVVKIEKDAGLNWTESSYDNQAGTISLAAGKPNPGIKTTADGSPFAKITFKAKKVGTTNIALTDESKVFANSDNANILGVPLIGQQVEIKP